MRSIVIKRMGIVSGIVSRRRMRERMNEGERGKSLLWDWWGVVTRGGGLDEIMLYVV